MEWQPRDTAPKDGTKVIVHTYTGKVTVAYYFKGTGLWPQDYPYSEDGEPCNVGWVTHWMPLPNPPTAT